MFGCFKIITHGIRFYKPALQYTVLMSIVLILSIISAHTQHCPVQVPRLLLVDNMGSHPCQSDHELKGHLIQNGTRHAQLLISPVWEMMAFNKGGQLELKCHRFGFLTNLSQVSPLLLLPLLESLCLKWRSLQPPVYTEFLL